MGQGHLLVLMAPHAFNHTRIYLWMVGVGGVEDFGMCRDGIAVVSNFVLLDVTVFNL